MAETNDIAHLQRDIGAVQTRLDALEKAQAGNTETLLGIKSRPNELRSNLKATYDQMPKSRAISTFNAHVKHNISDHLPLRVRLDIG